jgi:hypothetical protein
MYLRAGVISLALLLASRVLGLLRESAQAATFGDHGAGDVVVMMLMLPDWPGQPGGGWRPGYVLLPHCGRGMPSGTWTQPARCRWLLLGWGCCMAVPVAWLAGPLATGRWLVPGASAPHCWPGCAWAAWCRFPGVAGSLWYTRLQHERDAVGMYEYRATGGDRSGHARCWGSQRLAARHRGWTGVVVLLALALRLACLGWAGRSGAACAPLQPAAAPGGPQLGRAGASGCGPMPRARLPLAGLAGAQPGVGARARGRWPRSTTPGSSWSCPTCTGHPAGGHAGVSGADTRALLPRGATRRAACARLRCCPGCWPVPLPSGCWTGRGLRPRCCSAGAAWGRTVAPRGAMGRLGRLDAAAPGPDRRGGAGARHHRAAAGGRLAYAAALAALPGWAPWACTTGSR